MGFYRRFTHDVNKTVTLRNLTDTIGQWISVEDSLPDYNSSILFLTVDGYIQLGYRFEYADKDRVGFYQREGCNNKADKKIDGVIFWIPVPALTKAAKEKVEKVQQEKADAEQREREAIAEANKQRAIELNKRQTKFAESLGYASLSDLSAGTIYQILSEPNENKFVIWRGVYSETYTSQYPNLSLYISREVAEIALAQFCPICNRTFGTSDGAVSHMLSKHPDKVTV